jgi:DDE superfamily endonuclease/Helix-turn-helix of DDE superfamily endonuclease
MEMIRYDVVKHQAELFRSMTSLDTPEFEKMLDYFRSAWMAYRKEAYKEPHSPVGRKPILETIEDKLLFILFYFKTYPLQEVLAFQFDMSQSQACYWIHVLDKVLRKALASMGHLPERDPSILASTLSENGRFVIDGTERRIQRPKDNEEQQKYYSGKKKTHSVKNNVIVNMDTRMVEHLSGTCEGKKHDKKICDEERPTLPQGCTLYKDTGYQGYEPEGIETIQPKKKPRGKELTDEEKEANRLISSVRVVVEHVISGIKRCRIVKDIFRNTKDKFADLAMEIACGLHNLRNHCRSLVATSTT